MDSCEGCCGGEVCCRYKGSLQPSVTVWRVQTQRRAIPFDFSSSASNAQIDSASSHSHTRIVSSTSCLSQSRCRLHGNRIYRHSQGPRHGGDDFQAVRPHLAYVALLIDPSCAGNSSAAKSSVKKRQGGRRILQIGLHPRTGTAPRTRLRTRKIFRLMYVSLLICAL
jgi:hypothetical protein